MEIIRNHTCRSSWRQAYGHFWQMTRLALFMALGCNDVRASLTCVRHNCVSALEPYETNLLQAVSSARLLTLYASFENSAKGCLQPEEAGKTVLICLRGKIYITEVVNWCKLCAAYSYHSVPQSHMYRVTT